MQEKNALRQAREMKNYLREFSIPSGLAKTYGDMDHQQQPQHRLPTVPAQIAIRNLETGHGAATYCWSRNRTTQARRILSASAMAGLASCARIT